jgi:hypothetical protein
MQESTAIAAPKLPPRPHLRSTPLNDVTNRNNDQARQRAERDLATPLKAFLFSAGESLIAFR